MKIRELKGIGDKTEKLFNKLNIYDSDDLLYYFPRNYDAFREPVTVSEIEDSGIHSIYGMIANNPELITKGRFKILNVIIKDQNGTPVKITWFNMPFLKNQLKRGYRFIFRGKVAFSGNLVFMEQPVIYTEADYDKKLNSLQPIYGLTAGLTNNLVQKAVKQSFENAKAEPEYLPESIIKEYDFIDCNEARYLMHFPKDMDELLRAKKRVVFDEFFLFTMSIKALKNIELTNNFHVIYKGKYSELILKKLPYDLTNAQKKVYDEIIKDMSGNRTMNRLVQGDVGSGKTILAFLAMINSAECGFQSALMAPTEVLATQHYEALNNLIVNNDLPFKVALLTGSVTAANKKKIKQDLINGDVNFVIGTHAVITDDVEFNSLALVITDEQHRFGVRQRQNLSQKGCNTHVLVMSATPIPRSLAIILYGDLDISIIDEKPAERLPIKNCIIDDSYRANTYKFIKDELAKGHQAYIICAMAEETENDNDELENVVNYSDKIRKEFSSDINIEYLHGKMKSGQKNDIMARFSAGEINILVSTTVVEVGINVPNATVMVIENAERFGLAGLHQLRGRVGRGREQSYCIFISNSKNKLTKERLQILKDSNDGFYISEQDLKLRGPGDILGCRQSGEMGFKIGNIYADAKILKIASDVSNNIFEDDPTLEKEKYKGIRNKLETYMENISNKLNL